MTIDNFLASNLESNFNNEFLHVTLWQKEFNLSENTLSWGITR